MLRERVVVSGNISWFEDLGLGYVESVGGKNASLGEMVQYLSKAGARVLDGFATTSAAYRRLLAHGGLAGRISPGKHTLVLRAGPRRPRAPHFRPPGRLARTR